jgi:stress-induced morphogen
MIAANGNAKPDQGVQQVLDVLREYESAHAGAQIEVYRQNPVSIRIRIVDPDFRGMDRVDRDSLLWKTLEKLPHEVQSDLTLLLLLTPDEKAMSFADFEFDHPVPSAI